MIEHDNDCVSCEHCRSCGRGSYSYVLCDGCGENSDTFIEIDDKHYCLKCFKDMLPQAEAETKNEVFTMYLCNGEWHTEEEVESIFEEECLTEQEVIGE